MELKVFLQEIARQISVVQLCSKPRFTIGSHEIHFNT
jgi:hypothetical protein